MIRRQSHKTGYLSTSSFQKSKTRDLRVRVWRRKHGRPKTKVHWLESKEEGEVHADLEGEVALDSCSASDDKTDKLG